MGNSSLLICDYQVIMTAVGDGICMSLEPARNARLFIRPLCLSIKLAEITDILVMSDHLLILFRLVVLPDSLLHEFPIDKHDFLSEEWQVAGHKSITLRSTLFLHTPRHSIPQNLLLAELISQLVGTTRLKLGQVHNNDATTLARILAAHLGYCLQEVPRLVIVFVAKLELEAHLGPAGFLAVEFSAQSHRKSLVGGRLRLILIGKIYDDTLILLIHIPVHLESVEMIECVHINEAS